MSSLEIAKPLERDDSPDDSSGHTTANPVATRAAQAFAGSPQMKVLAEIQQARAAKRAAR